VEKKTSLRPSDLLNNSRILNYIIVIAGVTLLVPYFAVKRIDGLELSTATFFLMLWLALHSSSARYIASLKEAVKAIGELVVQFPFYVGIMGLFMFSGLSEVVTQLFVSISTVTTFTFFAFITVSIVNLFIRSGGGEWTVMASILILAIQEMGLFPENKLYSWSHLHNNIHLITSSLRLCIAESSNVEPQVCRTIEEKLPNGKLLISMV